MKMGKRGFTLIELIIVVIIIGILAAIAAPMMSANVNRAKRAEGVAGLGAIRTATRLYKVDNPTLTPGMGDLGSYITNTDLNGRYYNYGNYTIAGTLITAANIGFGNATMDMNTGVLSENNP